MPYQTVHYRVSASSSKVRTLACWSPSTTLLEGPYRQQERPQLDPDLFRIGLAADLRQQKGGTLRALNADRAALLATDELVARSESGGPVGQSIALR